MPQLLQVDPESESHADPAACDTYVFAPDPQETNDLSQLKTITACLTDLAEALQRAESAGPSAAVNREIIQMRINYKRLKKWIPERMPAAAPGQPPAPAEWTAAVKAERQAAANLQLGLRKHDLFATFAAVLITGATLTDAGQPEKEENTPPAADAPKVQEASADAQALGTIIWQSRHFGDESIRTIDWSVGGRIGIQPVLNLVTSTPPDAAEDAPPVVGAVHQNAFTWNFGVQLHKPVRGINSEFGWFGSAGSSTLTTLPKAVDKGTGSFVAFPLDYGAQKTAWLWETGVSFNIFDNPLEQIHAEKGTLSPQFQALIAIRRDERFRGTLFDDYESPTGRLVFRLTLDAIRVFDRRQFGEVAKPFTFGFVVEHERSLATQGTRVPSATRFVLRGDINLLHALSGAPEDKKKAEEQPAPAHTWTVALPTGPLTLTVADTTGSVTVVLTKLALSGSTVETKSGPSVTITRDKPGLISTPACQGATLEFTLAGQTLTLTPRGWQACSGTATFSVQETSK